MAIVGGPGKADEVSSAYCGDKAPTRFSIVFKFHKEGDNVGIVSPMGRKHGVHTRKKDSQIWAASRAMSNEWLAGNMPAVEVGCRGFNARSMSKALSSIGISGAGKRKALKNITTAAERATNWLWIS